MVKLPPEKLGSFYLGAVYDNEKQSHTSESVNYDARDLTTHAVCVGMTGSGKTGLCIGLLEEAAIDKVPALIIDPKGDMTNLLLQFENLEPEEFKKWINPDDAARKGQSIDDFASGTATKWKEGLASWGQDLERIKLLKSSVDYTIYTPGSDSGVPINILGSFKAPGINFDDDAEMLRERIQGTVAALLGMINKKVDPVRSKEGILLATLFEHHWRKNENLDLGTIILGIQNPPIKKLGVFDVDTFYPEKERFELAMDFNTLVASPQFQYWLEGDDLDIEKMYYTSEGQPRHSVFYIAHLSDSERMFFVTLLLNSLITWMRRQSGTTSLRSLVYFDEIFGYFPPTANPPSKKPLLTLLKQARAYGVGAVLVTQNPVDIDYKGLSNAGTWFIGKLQTERDKARVLEGLEGAIAEAGGAGDVDFSQLISSLSSRVFLMHNVHDSAPVIFNTRWVMSYLRGPMTRPQVKTLMKERKSGAMKKEFQITPTPDLSAKAKPTKQELPPSLDPGIDQRFFAVWKSASEAAQEMLVDDQLKIAYQPMVLARARVRFYNDKRDIDEVKDLAYCVDAPDDFGRSDWGEAKSLEDWKTTLFPKPDHPDTVTVNYKDVPDSMNSVKELNAMEKEFSNWLYETQELITYEHEELELYQKSGESDEAFLSRVQQEAREERDDEVDELQEKYEPKFKRVEERIRKEEQDLEEAKSDVRHRRTSEMIGVAETVFSVLLKGRRRSLSGSASKRRMSRKAKLKVEESKEDLEELNEDLHELDKIFQDKVDEVKKKWENFQLGITKKEIKPRRTDVKTENLILLWYPYWVSESGQWVSARR